MNIVDLKVVNETTSCSTRVATCTHLQQRSSATVSARDRLVAPAKEYEYVTSITRRVLLYS